ncbi:MAG: protein kinase domain-containing protein, partial [bacterium]
MLGQGNSGVVFLIHDGEIEAALKVIAIPRDQVALDEMYHRYGSEANVNAVIDHEHQYAAEEIRIMRKLKGLSNIVCFEDSKIYPRSDTYGWDVIIRMERLVRLDEFLEKPSRYGYRWNLYMVLKIWTDLVKGLYYCERNGIVHMDIKPDNIFYTGENTNLFKLGDFGVSIRSENGKVSAGIEAGTRPYMSPEIRSAQGGDVRSDIYSLAMVIYELLNDECLPFMSRHPTDVEMERAVEQRCTPGQEVPPIKDLDPAFSRILMRCLRYKPEERYQTMRELDEDLQKYVIGGDDLPKPRRLPKWLLPTIGIGTAGALAFVGYLIFRPQQIAPLSSVESALIDHTTGNIVVHASTEMYAQLLVKGQKGEKVRLDITREGTASRVSGNEIILNSNGSQSIWSYTDHALEDGIYQFLAYYPDQPDSQPLLLEATIDRNAPDVPSLEGDLPVASVDWELQVFAETGATVKLYAGDEVIATQIADSQGLARFSRAFEANVNYGLTATDAVGNESARYSFNAVVREIVAQLSEVDEDSVALIITADAEGMPNLAENGAEVSLEKTDATHYRYVPSEGFVVGTVYTLTVTDQYGITARDEKAVAASSWRKIELSTKKMDDEVFLISGMAEDGTQVQLMWNGEPFGDLMTVVDGGFSAELSMAEVGIDENGGSGTLSAKYAQGAASRASDAVQVRWASTVEPVYYAQIHLMTIPELDRQGEAHIVSGATGTNLQLFLTDGSGGLPVEVTLTDKQGNETIYSEALTLSANGTVQLEAGLDGLDDGHYTLSVAYQEQPEARYAWDIIVDRTPPAVETDTPSPYVGVEWTLDVSTEPGARVALFADDAQIDAATATDDGRATFVHTFEAGTAYHIEAEDACGNRSRLTIAPVVRRVVASFDGANEDDERLVFSVDPLATEFELARNGERQPDSAMTLLSEDDDGSVYAWHPPEGHLTPEDVFTLTVRDEYGLTGTDEVTVGSSAWRTIELEIHGVNEAGVINSRFIGDSVIELRDGTPGEMIDWRIYREGEAEPIFSGAEQLSDDGGISITGAFIELKDGDYTFIAAYSEQPGKRYTLDFAVDVTPPSLAIDEPSPYIGAEWTLNIRTEAGARVALLANGAELDSATVPDDGQAAFTYTFEANVEYQIAAEDAFGNRGAMPVLPVVRQVVAAIEKANEDDDRLLFRVDAEVADFELKRNGDVLSKDELIEEPDGGNGTAYAWLPPEGHLTMDDVFTLTVWDIYGLTGSDERSVSASAWPEIGIAISTETLNRQSVNSAVVALSDGAPGEPVDWFIVGTSATQPAKSGTARLSAEDGACEIEDAFTGIEDGEYRFVIRYSAQPDKQNEASFALDTTPPTLSVDDSSPYAEVDWVTRVDTEPGARVSLLVNGAAAQSKLADDTGTVEFNYVYNVGADCVVQATDAAGNVSRVSIKPQVKSVMARVLPLNETDDTVLFTIDADTDSFELLHNGVRVPESEIESLGGEEYGWHLSEGRFAVGDNIRLTVWDVYGLEATDAQIVEQVDWAQIELKVNNGYQGGNTVYRSTLEVVGSAQTNETVQLLWNGKSVGGEIRTRSDGAFSAALPIADTALPETGGTGMLSARYASGFAAGRAAADQQVIWTPKETVRLDVQSLSEDSEALVIETDPGATLTITQRRNGSELFADEWISASGREAWTLPDGGIFTEGDEFTIHAQDMIGNENDATR